MIKESQKGVSIYMVLMIMMFILAMVFGLSAILINQIKISAGISNSVQAFYAADTGIERALVNPDQCKLHPCPLDEKGQATYFIKKSSNKSECSNPLPENYCLKSVGSYAGTTRAIEVKQ
jgi:Tfp pilus assembly protein PilX